MCHINPGVFTDERLDKRRVSLTNDMKRLSQQAPNLYADITFEVEGQKIQAHRNIISLRSPELKKIIQQHKKNDVIKLEDQIPFNIFHAIIDFCYHGDCDIPNNPMELIRWAHHFRIQPLIFRCEQSIINDISTQNVLQLMIDAHKYQATEVLEKCFQFVLENYNTVSSQPDFSELPKDLLISLIRAVRTKLL